MGASGFSYLGSSRVSISAPPEPGSRSLEKTATSRSPGRTSAPAGSSRRCRARRCRTSGWPGGTSRTARTFRSGSRNAARIGNRIPSVWIDRQRGSRSASSGSMPSLPRSPRKRSTRRSGIETRQRLPRSFARVAHCTPVTVGPDPDTPPRRDGIDRHEIETRVRGLIVEGGGGSRRTRTPSTRSSTPDPTAARCRRITARIAYIR